MSEKQEIFKNELYNKFFIELKKKENIDKEKVKFNSEVRKYNKKNKITFIKNGITPIP